MTISDLPAKKGGAAAALLAVVPAHDAGATLGACLGALFAAGLAPGAVVVVDDGSRDDTARIARVRGVRVLGTGGRGGAAAARNAGAQTGAEDIVLFVDADVTVAPDAVDRIRAAFAADPGLAAVYGSYDDAPPAPGLASRVRNLLHHHVHQSSAGPSASFWTGLGAVRRAAFEAVGGFHPEQRMMEDVRFGRALWRAGYRTELRPDIQGTHLKRWSFGGMVRTDLFDRALPWSRMLLERGGAAPPAELNVSAAGKASVAAVGLSIVAATALLVGALADVGVVGWVAGGVLVLTLTVLIWVNRGFLALVARRLGQGAAVGAVPILWAHYAAGGAGFALALAERAWRSDA